MAHQFNCEIILHFPRFLSMYYEFLYHNFKKSGLQNQLDSPKPHFFGIFDKEIFLLPGIYFAEERPILVFPVYKHFYLRK